jgi:hypothetical protein
LKEWRGKGFLAPAAAYVSAALCAYGLARLNGLVFLPLLVIAVALVLVRRTRTSTLVATVIALMLVCSPALDTALSLKNSLKGFLLSPGTAMGELFTPLSGRGVLPQEVQDSVWLLEKHDVPEYLVSHGLDDGALISQRLTESTWPRMRGASGYILCRPTELVGHPEWSLVETHGEVSLVRAH